MRLNEIQYFHIHVYLNEKYLCYVSGASHELVLINLLVSKLTDVVNEKKVWIYDKEEHLLGMSKQLTAIISDWDTETQQMIDNLHQSRDQQVVTYLNFLMIVEWLLLSPLY